MDQPAPGALSAKSAATADSEVLVVLVGDDGVIADDRSVDAGTRGLLEAAYDAMIRTGPMKAPVTIPAPDGLAAELVVLSRVTGSAEDEALRAACGAAFQHIGHARSAAVPLPEQSQRAVMEGALLGNYRYNRYLDAPRAEDRSGTDRIDFLTGRTPTKALRTMLAQAQATAAGVNLARDMVNAPPNKLYPSEMASLARATFKDSEVDVKVWGPKELRRGGYGGLTAVGQGSRRGPRLIRLRYAPKGATTSLAFVGKGITFDSGGLSLKGAKPMEWMKSDLGGAAAVMGAVMAIAARQLPVNVTGWLCAAENMPDGGAQRPSDVITIRGGRTVEVLNTDAEGRLVLADGLTRAAEDDPDLIVDVATLTGASMVALGSRVAGVMGQEETRDAVVHCATEAGESAWAMPLPDELRATLDSEVADIANIGGPNGGMLSAAVFLREFVPQQAWAHVDMAGPGWNSGSSHGYTPKGGTGWGVRTLLQVAIDNS